jgi:hypothetical protein
MKEMRSRIHRITQDLDALLKELAVVREEHTSQLLEEALAPEIIKEFKSSVDAMRRILWLYSKAASRNAARQRGRQRPGAALQALKSLRQSGSTLPAGAGRSFIERVQAIVDKKIHSLPD